MEVPGRHVTTTVAYGVAQLAKTYRQRVGAAISVYGLHPGHELVLLHLSFEDGLSQRALAERVGIEQPTMARSLLRLEKSGFVSRAQGADGRVRHVFLSRRGVQVQERLEVVWDDLEADLSREIDPRVASSVVDRLRKNLTL